MVLLPDLSGIGERQILEHPQRDTRHIHEALDRFDGQIKPVSLRGAQFGLIEPFATLEFRERLGPEMVGEAPDEVFEHQKHDFNFAAVGIDRDDPCRAKREIHYRTLF